MEAREADARRRTWADTTALPATAAVPECAAVMGAQAMGELKTCPFCDWKPVVRSRNAKGVASGKHYFVRCPMCHTEGPRSTTSEALAVQKWNKRPSGGPDNG
jgi:hypothetical protein